jgi:ABC-type glycerol-3-phosphate transport system substrate-binding protein
MRVHRIFWSLVLCALVMLPASVASARSHRATANLTFALWDKNQIPAMQKIITKFQQLHPDVRITIEKNIRGLWAKARRGMGRPPTRRARPWSDNIS